MFYNFIQEKIAIFQVSEEWQSIIIVLISYFVLFLLTFIFKQILSLFNKLVVSKAIKKSKITWDDIIWDLGIFKQVILVASFIFILSTKLSTLFVIFKSKIPCLYHLTHIQLVTDNQHLSRLKKYTLNY